MPTTEISKKAGIDLGGCTFLLTIIAARLAEAWLAQHIWNTFFVDASGWHEATYLDALAFIWLFHLMLPLTGISRAIERLRA